MPSLTFRLATSFLFLGMIPLHAQEISYVSSTLWSKIQQVQVSNDRACCVFYSGLGIIDVSSPSSPELVGKLFFQSMPRNIHVAGEYAYLTADRLYIIDLSNDSAPAIVGSLAGSASDVFVMGNYAYVTSGSLKIVDVSNPAAPVLVTTFPPPETTSFGSVFGQGQYVFVTYSQYIHDYYKTGFQIIDGSDPQNPVVVGMHQTDLWFDYYYNISVAGEQLFLQTVRGGIIIFDISDPSQPVQTGQYQVYYSGGYFVDGNNLYVTAWNFGLRIVDITDPSNPAEIGSCYIPQGAGAIFVDDGRAYVASDSPGGMHAIDVSDPETPQITGVFSTPGMIYDLAIGGSYAYVIDYTSGLRILDIGNPEFPVEIALYTSSSRSIHAVVEDTLAYVSTEGSGLKIIDVSDPANPDYISNYMPPRGVGNFTVHDGILFVPQDSFGMHIADISDPLAPHALSTVATLDAAHDVAVSGNYAYVTIDRSGLEIFNIENLSRPVHVSNIDEAYRTYDIAVQGDYVYATDSNRGLGIYDVSNPAYPRYLSFLAAPSTIGLAVSGNRAYLAGYGGGIAAVDISDPLNPALLASFETPGIAFEVVVAGDEIYIADWRSLIVARMVATGVDDGGEVMPRAFYLSQNYPNPFNATTTISYTLSARSAVTIDIFDIAGRAVETIARENRAPGHHSIVWDAARYSSGVYFYRLTALGLSEIRSCVLLK